MSIHFSEPEFSQRIDRVLARLQHEELDGLLIFRPESMYYLCGFDTFGYAMFQCLYLGSDGRLVLLTRAPDRLQAQLTSTLTDIRIWRDRAGHEPVAELDDMLRSLGCAGAALGIELDTVGLTAANGNRLQQQLDGFCTLRDCSELINQIRLVKSPAELACIETAASLADDALDAAIAHTAAGADEAVILAEMQGAVLRGGGDYAGNEFIIGSADHALLCRYHSGRRRLDNNDQLTLEWAGCYHRYHAAMMRTLLIGKVDSEHRHMFAVARDALIACESAMRPGNALGDVFHAHASVADEGGLNHARLNACGYSMGCAYAPIWVDHPMIYQDNPLTIRENMVFFLHMIFVDDRSGRAMTLGHSVAVEASGCRRLSRHQPELICC